MIGEMRKIRQQKECTHESQKETLGGTGIAE